MTADQVLQYEARVRPRQVVIAAVAAVLVMVSAIMGFTGPKTAISELTTGLLVANKRFGLDLVASIFNAIAYACVGSTLLFLVGAARARNDQTQSYIKYLAMVGPVLAGLANIAYTVAVGITAHKFATTGNQTYPEAHHLTEGAGYTILQILLQVGTLLLAISICLVCVSALRVGLLGRFPAYLGMFAGVLFLFPIIQVPVFQVYWLFAIAYLLSGRWPSGVPPAWATGRAEKLPTSAEIREQRIRASGGKGRGKKPSMPEPEPVGASVSQGTSSRSPGAKRKRKRRK